MAILSGCNARGHLWNNARSNFIMTRASEDFMVFGDSTTFTQVKGPVHRQAPLRQHKMNRYNAGRYYKVTWSQASAMNQFPEVFNV